MIPVTLLLALIVAIGTLGLWVWLTLATMIPVFLVVSWCVTVLLRFPVWFVFAMRVIPLVSLGQCVVTVGFFAIVIWR